MPSTPTNESGYSDLPPIWQICLEQAWQSYKSGSLPIGAAIVNEAGDIIATGRNRLAEAHETSPHLPGTPYLTGTPLAHAEVNAILEMGYNRPEPRPTLYTTMEPCPLCMGAARMAGIGKIIYAARDLWAGAAIMANNVPYLQRMGPTAQGPVAELEEPLITWLLTSIPEPPDGPFKAAWTGLFPHALEAANQLQLNSRLTKVQNPGEAWQALTATATAPKKCRNRPTAANGSGRAISEADLGSLLGVRT